MMSLPAFSLATFLLLLTLTPAPVTSQADEYTARKFCVDVLKQSKIDATQCLLKPRGYKIEMGKDPAVLTYLCCLGTFHDVTHNYIRFMSNDLLLYLAMVDSANTLLKLGTFVSQCSRRKPKVTRRDYTYWSNMGENDSVCQSPWK